MARKPIAISTINPDALVVIHQARWLKANNACKVVMDIEATIETERYSWSQVVMSRDAAADVMRASRLPEQIIIKLLNGAGCFPQVEAHS